ncbi:hypothetical protein ES707_22011 [subsurface metagenome]
MKKQTALVILLISYLSLALLYPNFIGVETSESKNSNLKLLENSEEMQIINDAQQQSYGIGEIKSAILQPIEEESNEDWGKESMLTGEGENKTIEEILQEFKPNVDVIGKYLDTTIEGEIQDNNTIMIFPEEGDYIIEGSLDGLNAQYLQNPGAETNQLFYSDNVLQGGDIEITREKDSRSFEGDYIWKFYAQSTEQTVFSLFQDEINLYNGNTKISYNYLLESNSSLKDVINSSLIFDLVFDTCRIMVIHWHYTDIDPPLIGGNTTEPFVVYRLLQNSSWNDQWNSYSLNFSDLFEPDDPYIPKKLKSIGFFVVSSEYSECSMLLDNFEIKTSLTPTDIDLKINDEPVRTIEEAQGDFTLQLQISDSEIGQEYCLNWYSNSSFELNGHFQVNVSGTVVIPYTTSIEFNGGIINYTIFFNNLSSSINPINISYPNVWDISNLSEYCDNVSSEEYDTQRIVTLTRLQLDQNFYCSFSIENLIAGTIYEPSLTVFETINMSFNFVYPPEINIVYVFWSNVESGSISTSLINNKISFTYPSDVPCGLTNTRIIIIEEKTIGFVETFVNLTRIPAKLIVMEDIDIPQYGLKMVEVSYESLVENIEIDSFNLFALLEDEEIFPILDDDNCQIPVSTYLLGRGAYNLTIYASSTTHASLECIIKINVYENEIKVGFNYDQLDVLSKYQLVFNATIDGFPISFAPLRINIDGYQTLTGVTDIEGKYYCHVTLPLDIARINVSISLTKLNSEIYTERYIIEFEALEAKLQINENEIFISDNITLNFQIQYPVEHDRWFLTLLDEMIPIIEAYIETETYRIPVFHEENTVLWQTFANENTNNHKLVIITSGPSFSVTYEQKENQIIMHFIIESALKTFQKISMLHPLNNSISTAKYQWKLLTSDGHDVTRNYELEVNDLYVYFTNVNISEGSYLILNLVGEQISDVRSMTNIIIPAVSGSSVLLGAVAAIIKVYNKKKSMILEI